MSTLSTKAIRESKIGPEYCYSDTESEFLGEYNNFLKKELFLKPGDLQIIRNSVLLYTKYLEKKNDLAGIVETNDLLSFLSFLCRNTPILFWFFFCFFFWNCKQSVKLDRPQYTFDYPILIRDIKDASCMPGVIEEGISAISTLEEALVRKISDSLSSAELQEISEAYHSTVLRDFDLVASPDTVFLQEIVDRLSAVLDSNKIDHPRFKIYLVQPNDQEIAYINAFSTGSLIYFSVDLLSLLKKNPNEVATIVGHELSHSYLGHNSLYILRARLANSFLGHDLGDRVASFWQSYIATPIGQSNELECDLSAVRLMFEADFDPASCTAPYYRMMQQMKYRDKSIFRLLLSHPLDETRLACVASAIERARIHAKENAIKYVNN